jgi:hypothetical protein
MLCILRLLDSYAGCSSCKHQVTGAMCTAPYSMSGLRSPTKHERSAPYDDCAKLTAPERRLQPLKAARVIFG